MWEELSAGLYMDLFESWEMVKRPLYKRGGSAVRSGFGASRGNHHFGTGGAGKNATGDDDGQWKGIVGLEIPSTDKEGNVAILTSQESQIEGYKTSSVGNNHSQNAEANQATSLARSFAERWQASLEQGEESQPAPVQPGQNPLMKAGERQPTRWLRTNRRNPCPCCGKFGWCEVSDDGNKAHCMHSQEEGRAVEYRGGGRIIQLRPESRVDTQYLYRPMPVERLEPALVDEINQEFLKRCPLKPAHGAYLAEEGVPIEEVGSLELYQATRIAGELVAEYGEEVAGRHPLFKQFTTRDGQRRYWGIAGAENGILFPARDKTGRILGIQLRADHPADKERRYRWLSSEGKGGTPLTVFPGQGRGERTTTIVITEGYKKAAAVNHSWGSPAISLAGVGAYNREELIDTIRASGAREIAMAFDQDKSAKWQVQEAEERILKLLGEQLPEMALYRVEWDGQQGKGLDEALKAGAEFRFEPVLELVEHPVMAGKEAAQTGSEQSGLPIKDAAIGFEINEVEQEATREAQWAALKQLQADTSRFKHRGK